MRVPHSKGDAPSTERINALVLRARTACASEVARVARFTGVRIEQLAGMLEQDYEHSARVRITTRAKLVSMIAGGLDTTHDRDFSLASIAVIEALRGVPFMVFTQEGDCGVIELRMYSCTGEVLQ